MRVSARTRWHAPTSGGQSPRSQIGRNLHHSDSIWTEMTVDPHPHPRRHFGRWYRDPISASRARSSHWLFAQRAFRSAGSVDSRVFGEHTLTRAQPTVLLGPVFSTHIGVGSACGASIVLGPEVGRGTPATCQWLRAEPRRLIRFLSNGGRLRCLLETVPPCLLHKRDRKSTPTPRGVQ